MNHVPIDAFPDTTPVQVQINTTTPALSPLEVEQQLTFPIEQSIGALPKLKDMRSVSKFGLSQITLTFADDMDLFLARQMVMERLQTVQLPQSASVPQMGPLATGLGEVLHYVVRSRSHDLQTLTTLQEWVIKPQLLSLPGVAEVSTWGGAQKQYHVQMDPDAMRARGVTFEDLQDALRANNMNVGGGNLQLAGEQFLIQGLGVVQAIEEIEAIAINTASNVPGREGVPVLVRDVARVVLGHEIRRGAATSNAQGEVVLGLAFMMVGENSYRVTNALSERLASVSKQLPDGVVVEPLYVRTELIEKVLNTVKKNLLEGALLVVAVLFVFLGSVRAGLIVASAIPISMLFAANGMAKFGIAGSLMSLGAIDFGLVVDSSVIMVENSVRRLRHADPGTSVKEVVRNAAIEVRKPTMFGELIIMLVYLPILTLEGVEGKLFRPMALTVMMALAGSLILSLTLMPVLVSLCLGKTDKHREGLIMPFVRRCYTPLVDAAIRVRVAFIMGTLILMVAGLIVAGRLGSQFIPKLSEMGIVINAVRLSGVGLDESVRYGGRLEAHLLASFPDEIQDVWARTGTADVITDPMGIELSDIFVTLTPRSQWTQADTQESLMDQMRTSMSVFPGTRLAFTQPIELRMNEMVSGIRSDLGVKVFGDDLEVLQDIAAQIDALLRTLPGAEDVATEQVTGQRMLTVHVDRAALGRFGLSAQSVLNMVASLGTYKVGEVREGQRRFDLVMRWNPETRLDPHHVAELVIPLPDGGGIPLDEVADIRIEVGPANIQREWMKRRIAVTCNVHDRDLGSFVKEAEQLIRERIRLPEDTFVQFGGQFEHMIRAEKRLAVVVPLALLLILFLLHTSTGSIADSLMIFTGAPFAALGGILLLWLTGIHFTISAGVGFVAVCGVSMLNGLVLMASFRQNVNAGMDLPVAIKRAALNRLRPVLMTTLVAGLGFLPMVLNTGVGAEVQRPLALVVLGGVLSDTLLTLLVLPSLMTYLGRNQLVSD